MKTKVAAVRCGDDIFQAVDSLAEHLGGWHNLVSRGETVVLKPNLVAPRRSETGATTSLRLLAVMLDRLSALGTHPEILESPGMEYRREDLWRFFDLPGLARKHGASLLPMESRDWVRVKVPGGRALRKAWVHRAALDHRLFNLAKLKTHIITGATLCMKNLMGVCHDDTKRFMHIAGIHEAVVDLSRVVTPALNVIDGIVGMEGDGAVYGRAKPLGTLLASANALAADLVGLECMGMRVAQVPHLKRAGEVFGVPAMERVGSGFLRNPFLIPKPSKAYLLGYRLLYVMDLWFHRVNGMHFNEYLYRKGMVGTRPHILAHLCNGCGACREQCPVPPAINVTAKKIDMMKCLRCLECLDHCPHNAIAIKGMSGVGGSGCGTGKQAVAC